MNFDLKTIISLISAIIALLAGISWNIEFEKSKGFRNENIAYKIQVSSLGERKCE